MQVFSGAGGGAAQERTRLFLSFTEMFQISMKFGCYFASSPEDVTVMCKLLDQNGPVAESAGRALCSHNLHDVVGVFLIGSSDT